MPSKQPSIARIGSKPYLDSTADVHNGKDHAWLLDAMAKLKAGETTKKKMAEEMGIALLTLDKYIFIINLEKAQEEGRMWKAHQQGETKGHGDGSGASGDSGMGGSKVVKEV